jgi:hypothetical protein
MGPQSSDVIGGINETIKQQRIAFPESNIMFTVIAFSNNVNKPIDHTLATIPFFTEKDYRATGSTALFDAIGSTIDKYGEENNVMFLIMTDGEENASKKYNYSQITEKLDTVKEQKNWNIVYLSEGIDTFRQGETLGIRVGAKNCYNVTSGGGKLGSYLKRASCQDAITQIMSGSKDVQIPSEGDTDTTEQDPVILSNNDNNHATCSFNNSSGNKFSNVLNSLNPFSYFKKK